MIHFVPKKERSCIKKITKKYIFLLIVSFHKVILIYLGSFFFYIFKKYEYHKFIFIFLDNSFFGKKVPSLLKTFISFYVLDQKHFYESYLTYD